MAYVLIIEDDKDYAEAVSMALQNGGHETSVELDTQSGVKSMEKKRPDLVVLDVMFPEDSSAGFNLARTMRHYNEKLKDIPILMLTAVNTKFPLGFSDRDIDDHWLPVSDFVEKPVDFDILQAKVTQLLQKASEGAENANG